MNKCYLVVAFLLCALVSWSQNARVQIIHNSPTPTVDVYLGETLLLDNFTFRSATPFIDAPAGEEIVIGIALDNSTSSADVIASFPLTLDNGKTYVAVANGIVGNADTPFGLVINDMGQEMGTGDNGIKAQW